MMSTSILKTTLLNTLLFGLITISPHVVAQSPSSDLISKLRESTVFININDKYSGTGFVVTNSGFVLTAAHMVLATKDASPQIRGAMKSRYGTLEEMEFIGRDPIFDVALLKFKNTSHIYTPVKIGNPWALGVDDELIAMGFPRGIEYGSNRGRISGLGGPLGNWITDIPLNPGNSGGPVFNLAGEVVAVVILDIENAEGINFLLPITRAHYLLSAAGVQIPPSASRNNYPKDIFVVTPLHFDSVREPHGLDWYLQSREAQEIVRSVATGMGVNPVYLAVDTAVLPKTNIRGEETYYVVPIPQGYAYCASRIQVTSIVPAEGKRASLINLAVNPTELQMTTWTPKRKPWEGKSWVEGDIQVYSVKSAYLEEFVEKGICKKVTGQVPVFSCRGKVECGAGFVHGNPTPHAGGW